MTVEEFSDLFDVLLASYKILAPFGGEASLEDFVFNEYEKSVFLTLAQLAIVKEYYSGSASAFEQKEEFRRALDTLVKTKIYDTDDLFNIKYLEVTIPDEEDSDDNNNEEPSIDDNVENDGLEDESNATTLEQKELVPIIPTDMKIIEAYDRFNHTGFKLPDRCWFIVYELVNWISDSKCLNNKDADVVPITHDEYSRVKNNPFRGPNNRKANRLDYGDRWVDIVSSNKIGKYILKYVAIPNPIILVPLRNVSIDGYTELQTSELPTAIHKDILDVAVKLAIQSKTQTISNNKNNKSE